MPAIATAVTTTPTQASATFRRVPVRIFVVGDIAAHGHLRTRVCRRLAGGSFAYRRRRSRTFDYRTRFIATTRPQADDNERGLHQPWSMLLRGLISRVVVVVLLALVAVGAIALATGDGDRGGGADARPVVLPLTTATPFTGLQQQFVHVVQAVSPAVVEVRTAAGLGSGVVFDHRGDIVTNAHVVGGGDRFVVTLMGGNQHRATLVGADRTHDLAVLRLVGARPAPATFADSASLQVGDLVLAIGNPLGLRSSVTQGIVSSLGRAVQEADGVTLAPVIQTSAAINPGNSGGALVDLSGRVIGIPTLAATDPEFGNAQAPGIGFAIPSDTVQRVATSVIAGT
jgi:S1-C subfamily serine protease